MQTLKLTVTHKILSSSQNVLTTNVKLSEFNYRNSVVSKHSDSSASNDQHLANDNEPVLENINNNDFCSQNA